MGMKALIYRTYGGRDVYAIEDMPDPGPPEAGDVKVRVYATSINPVDAKVRRGELKLIAGRRFPKRPGLDFSGEVEAIGKNVTQFVVGDAVYGASRSMSEGAFAEHALVHAGSIARKPPKIDHVTAAGIPTVAIAALQSLRDIVKVVPGDRILVNGCTGGVGIFALQIAKMLGGFVAGVCGTDGVALAKQMGADDVIDYKTTDVTQSGGRYRAILELSGKLSFEAAGPILGDNGVYVDFSPSPAGLIGNAIVNPFRRRKHLFAMTSAKTADLDWISKQIDAEALRHAPTRVLPLNRFAEAFALAESGGTIGKIVVSLMDT